MQAFNMEELLRQMSSTSIDNAGITTGNPIVLRPPRRFDLLVQSPGSQSTCAHCSKPASNACAGCKDAPLFGQNSAALAEFFATVSPFYRAGDTIQKIFYLYRKKLYDRPIRKVEKEVINGKTIIRLYERPYEDLVIIFDLLCDFPENFFESEEDKHAVLTHMACDDGVAFLNEVFKHMLEGISSKIEEVAMKVHDKAKIKVVSIDMSGQVVKAIVNHVLLKVTLKHGGEQYAVDVSSAQFGVHTPVMPFTAYYLALVDHTLSRSYLNGSQTFGCTLKYLRDEIAEPGRNSGTANESCAVSKVNVAAYKILDQGLYCWDRVMGSTCAAMLHLPADDWKTKEKILLGLTEGGLEDVLKQIMMTNLKEKVAIRARAARAN